MLPLVFLVIHLAVSTGQATLLPPLVNPAYGNKPVDAGVLSKCIFAGEQVIESDGSSYLQFKPQSSSGGQFWILNSINPGCQPLALPELGLAAALQFEFRLPVDGDCDAMVKVSMGCQTTPAVLITDFIDTGMISASDWRVVTIPVSVLKNNSGLQGCGGPIDASWDLLRNNGRMIVTLCSECKTPGARQHVCHVRNLQFVGSLPTVGNKAPTISGLAKNVTVPFGGVAKLSAQVTDDGLPRASADAVISSVWQAAAIKGSVSWNVVQAPPSYEAGQVVITPFSSSAGVAWASFAGAAAGTYVLAITASDGQLERTQNVTLDHKAWPNAVAITSPRDNPLPGEPSYFFLEGPSKAITIEASLNIASTMTAEDYKLLTFDCNGPAPCMQVSPTTALVTSGNAVFANATFSFSTPGTYSISLKAEVDTGQVRDQNFPAVIQGVNRIVMVTTDYLVPRTVTWQPGTRIPYTAFHPDVPRWQGDPRQGGRGLMWPPLMQSLATVVVAKGGSWSLLKSKDTNGLLSSRDACVLIPVGRTVVYDVCDPAAPTYRCIVVLGKLYFSQQRSTCLNVGTLQLQDGGMIHIDHRREQQLTTNITFSTTEALNSLEDPALINVGLQAYHANVYMRGVTRCGHSLKAVDGILGSGTTTITVPGSEHCWRPGDKIVFADTQKLYVTPNMYINNNKEKFFRRHTELKQVVSVSPDGVVLLDSPLAYNHSSDVPLGMISRSITLQTDLVNSKARAHVFVSGLSTFQLRDVAIYDTGRTTIAATGDSTFDPASGAVIAQHYNPRGRYGCHSHKNRRPVVYQGVAVASNLPTTVPLPRHALVCHDSHCTVSNNTLVGFSGSGIFVEDGTETGTFSGNLVVCSGFGTGVQDQSSSAASLGKDVGHGGHGFWMRSTLVSLVDNTVVGVCPESAYTYFTKCTSGPQQVPRVVGINDTLRGISLETCKHGIGEYGAFNNNVAIGVFNRAVHHMYIEAPSTLGRLTVISNSAAVPVAVGASFSARIILDNPTLYATTPNKGVGITTMNPFMGNNGVNVRSESIVIRGGVIEGFASGIGAFPNGTLLEATRVRSTSTDISFSATNDFESVNKGANRLVELRGYDNQRFLVSPINAAATALMVAGVTLPGNMTTDGSASVGVSSGLFE